MTDSSGRYLFSGDFKDHSKTNLDLHLHYNNKKKTKEKIEYPKSCNLKDQKSEYANKLIQQSKKCNKLKFPQDPHNQ